MIRADDRGSRSYPMEWDRGGVGKPWRRQGTLACLFLCRERRDENCSRGNHSGGLGQPSRWQLHVDIVKIRGFTIYRFGGAREAAGSWGRVASSHYTGMAKNGCPRKRIKIEFFLALAYFHL
jgi:hypothetical protein